jgi:RNA polymerase nonessential primary-like sigma factor
MLTTHAEPIQLRKSHTTPKSFRRIHLSLPPFPAGKHTSFNRFHQTAHARIAKPKSNSSFTETQKPYAIRTAKSISRSLNIDFDDAFQIVQLAILEAARRFDPDRGHDFKTYAQYWIQLSTRVYGVSDLTSLHIPRHLYWRAWKMQAEHDDQVARNNHSLDVSTVDEMAQRHGIDLETWTAFSAERNSIPISELSSDQQRELASRTSSDQEPDDSLSERDFDQALMYGLQQLKLREFKVLVARYGLIGQPATLQQCGEELGLTRERVRQIQLNAEERIKRFIRRKFPELVGE